MSVGGLVEWITSATETGPFRFDHGFIDCVRNFSRFTLIVIQIQDRLFGLRGRAGCAEGRHFDGLAAKEDMRQTKPPADQTAVAEQLADLLRQCVRGDIEILRSEAQQQIADTAADQEGLEAPLAQPIQHAQGIGGDVRTGNRVLGPWNYPWFYGRCRGVKR